MSSTNQDTTAPADSATQAPIVGSSPAPAAIEPVEALLDDDGNFEVDEDEDSTYGSVNSTNSVTSSIYRGINHHGRRYQTLREGDYWGPADDKQFEAMEKGHLVHLVLDSNEPNKLFRSPIGDHPAHILDLGTGQGDWAVDVADQYPMAQVLGIDLYPPPQNWMPTNCSFEVDDVLKPWERPEKFDLVHLRWMLGSFTPQQWKGVYKQAYEHLAPGGWIEHLEPSLINECDDGTMPADSKQAQWGPMFYKCGKVCGRPLDVFETMKDSIIAAGFTEVHEHIYRIPVGHWPKNKLYKEAGRLQLEQLVTGLEGYAMMLLTQFGEPEPWTPEEVQVFLEGMKAELQDKKRHTWGLTRRVWARKPLN